MGPSIWQLLIIFLIVLMLFGAKRLRNIGSDLGAAIKGFRGAMKDGEDNKDTEAEPTAPLERIIEKPLERATEREVQGGKERIIEGEVTRKGSENNGR